MKSSLTTQVTSVVLGVIISSLCGPVAHAAWPGSTPKTDSNEQLARLFGKNTAFTAKARITIAGPSKQKGEWMEMQYAVRDGHVRTEMDFANSSAAQKQAEGMEQMIAMGMNKMVTIYRADENASYLVYPGMEAYCKLPSALPADQEAQPPKIERKEIGKESIDGHECVKALITITDSDGKQHELTAWQATDMDEFPIQTEIDTGDGRVITKFSDIKLAAPPAGLFQPPAGFQAYDNMQSMMMGSMQKMMGR